jgi:hypothetical protein
MIFAEGHTVRPRFVRRSVDRLPYSLFLHWPLDPAFSFWFTDLRRIESPTAVVIPTSHENSCFLYSSTIHDATPSTTLPL